MNTIDRMVSGPKSRLIAFFLVLPLCTDAIGQDAFTVNLPIYPNEKLGAPVLADINGDGEKELCVRVRKSNDGPRWLVVYDLKFQREIGRIRNIHRDSPFYSVDIDGDGTEELVTINTVIWGDKPGFIIYRWEQGRLTRTEYDSFYGDGGHVGDIDGDGRDEIILNNLPQGFTNSGGTGPVEIQVISWNGVNFDIKARTAIPETYMRIHVGDLNGNGRAEITILRSGYKRPNLSVFGYTHSRDLTLLDQWESPDVYNDNLTRLWSEPLSGSQQRIVIPIPEQYWEGENGQERIQFFGFQLTPQGTLTEPELVSFDEFRHYRHNGALPVFLRRDLQRIDVNQDGRAEILQIANRRIRLIRQRGPKRR